MLRRMDACNRTASVGVSEIEESVRAGSAAIRGSDVDLALIKIDGPCIEVRRAAVWNGSEFKIVSSVNGAAPSLVSAVGNSEVVDLAPSRASIGAFPNALIVVIGIDIPPIHFVAARNDSDFSPIDRANAGVRICWTCLRGQPNAGLSGKTDPVNAVTRRIESVITESGEEFPGYAVVHNRRYRARSCEDIAIFNIGEAPRLAGISRNVDSQIGGQRVRQAFQNSLRGSSRGCDHQGRIAGAERNLAERHSGERSTLGNVGCDQRPGCARIRRTQDAQSVVRIGRTVSFAGACENYAVRRVR